MTKAILFDGDGVTLTRGKEYFSERFVREYGAPVDEVRAFFRKEFPLCQTGKLDLKEELDKRLPLWGWTKSVDDYLAWWFENDTFADEEALAEVKRLREQGIICCMATDQDKYRSQYIREKLGTEARFDHLFFSSDLGYSKNEPEFFQEVIKRLGLNPEEIVYFDDDQENVDVAKSLGIDGHFYTGLQDVQSI